MQTLSFILGSFLLWYLGYAPLKNFSFLVQLFDIGCVFCQAFCEAFQSFMWPLMITYGIFLFGKHKMFRLMLHFLSMVSLWNGTLTAKS